jgi:TPP-dependent pyruvate/acetoin dehydrogenase alpha subunit
MVAQGRRAAVSSAVRMGRRRALQTGALALFERMTEIREFELRVNELFAEGLVHGTTHLCLGQEALAVALASVARDDDVVAATYRGHGIGLALGLTTDEVLAEIMGKEAGCTGGVGGSMHLSGADIGMLPTSAVIGAGMPMAVGAAVAFQNRAEDRVAVAVFGDGASNIGAFHESLNMAAVWRLPAVFICDNNLYGEYSRIDLTTSVQDIAVRADSYGIPGVTVDGMDLDAVNAVLTDAFHRARTGGGPTLVEAKTYRYAGHSRADKAEYRPAGEYDDWMTRDPILRFRANLIEGGVADGNALDTLRESVLLDLERCVAVCRAAPAPPVSAMFANVLAGAG